MNINRFLMGILIVITIGIFGQLIQLNDKIEEHNELQYEYLIKMWEGDASHYPDRRIDSKLRAIEAMVGSLIENNEDFDVVQ